MRRLITLFIIVISALFFMDINASTLYKNVPDFSNNYLKRFNSYTRYFVTTDAPYGYEIDEIKNDSNYRLGGLLNKDEFLNSMDSNGNTYLFNGLEFWTMTKSDSSKMIVINPKSTSKMSEFTYDRSSGIRNTEFVQNGVYLKGSGTSADPWTFVKKHYVTFVYDDTKITINPRVAFAPYNGAVVVNVINSKAYMYASNDCGAELTIENKLKLENIKKDITCNITTALAEHTITYSPEGYCTPNTKKVKHGKEIGTMCGPTKTGYTFKGWYDEEVGGTQVIKTTKLMDDMTLYARFEANTYTLTYDNNGGSGCTTLSGKYDQEWGTLCSPTRNGYSFEGWYSSPTGGVKVISSTKVTGDRTVYAHWKDTESPSLSLNAITYVEGFNGWTLSGATISNGILTIPNTTAYAESNYIYVNGGKWWPILDGYTETPSANATPKGGIYWGTQYYNTSFDSVTLGGSTGNGWAKTIDLNKWVNNINWYGSGEVTRYSNDIKYVQYKFSAFSTNSYSQPPIKVRNFKTYGEQIPNTFYLIKVSSSDNEGVIVTKYASGNRNASYFASNGTNVSNNEVRVTTNGEYTIYVADAIGNATVKTINITNIVNNATVTFNSHGGTGTMSNQSIPLYTNTTLKSNSFTKNGYGFVGWNVKENGTGINYANGGTINIGHNITLYAQWLPKATTPTTDYCSSPKYNTTNQSIVKPAGTGFTWTAGNTQKNTGTYTVTATLSSGYIWDDGTTGTKSIRCSILQDTPVVTLSSTSGTSVVGHNLTFYEQANVAGKFTVTSNATGKATVSQANSNTINANTNNLVTVTPVASGKATITIAFVPSDTTNYVSSVTKTYTATIAPKATIPSNSLCVARTYNGNNQQLTSVTSGTGYTLSGYTQKDANTYTITSTLENGYRWSDNTTGNKTFTCVLSPATLATPTVSIATNGKITWGNVSGATSYELKINSGPWDNTATSGSKSITTDTNGTYTAYVRAVGSGNYATSSNGSASATISDKITVSWSKSEKLCKGTYSWVYENTQYPTACNGTTTMSCNKESDVNNALVTCSADRWTKTTNTCVKKETTDTKSITCSESCPSGYSLTANTCSTKYTKKVYKCYCHANGGEAGGNDISCGFAYSSTSYNVGCSAYALLCSNENHVGNTKVVCSNANTTGNKTCSKTTITYSTSTSTSSNQTSCSASSGFTTCNSSNVNKSNVTCTPSRYAKVIKNCTGSYSWGSTSTATVSSCSSNNISCGSSTVGQTYRACSRNYGCSSGTSAIGNKCIKIN